MRLRSFNQAGVDQFTAYLGALKADPARPPPWDLLESPAHTMPLSPEVDISCPPCLSKLEVARYLVDVLKPVDRQTLNTDAGVWAWLALHAFDVICPADGRGRRSRLDISKYVPRQGDHRHGPRKHLLYLPWSLYSIHGEHADFLLLAPPSQERHEQREWARYSYLALSRAAVDVCRVLFWDEASCRFRKGAKSTKSGASIRAYLEYISYFDETYDLYRLSSDELLRMLPPRLKRLASRSAAT